MAASDGPAPGQRLVEEELAGALEVTGPARARRCSTWQLVRHQFQLSLRPDQAEQATRHHLRSVIAAEGVRPPDRPAS